MKHVTHKQFILVSILGGMLLTLPLIASADTVYTINNTTADAFLAAGSPINPVGTDLTSLNFGGAGTLAIAPAGSPKGQMDSVIKFNSSGAVSQFNSIYGGGNWQITGMTLKLASNFGVQGSQPNNGIFNLINNGSFGIDWLKNDAWVEGTGSGMGTPGYPGNSAVSFNSISSLYGGGYDPLGVFTYTPPGNNVYVTYSLPLNASLVSDAAAGGDVSLYFYAADNQISYLFNARSFAQNQPQFIITATAVPEPSTIALLGLAAGALLRTKRIRHAA